MKHLPRKIKLGIALAIFAPLAMATSYTKTTLSISNNPKVGQPITLTAVVTGPHSILSQIQCAIALASTTTIYDNGKSIYSEVSTANNSSQLNATQIAGGPCSPSIYYFSDKTTVNYTFTPQPGKHAYQAVLTDTYGLIAGSSSGIITLQGGSITPAIDYVLQ